ncbi:BglG family transcription antiterminator LicT [Streptococcus sp. S784/96/1]|uniref:BglG family transcription antiterminator LicT n=1 Tax=Streptococcus sp. S784/96/1 TaxID=2653499 RepID=UPI0013896163|nr:PRD domain-containing protein [Streptococcus sp. S784/96/1]
MKIDKVCNNNIVQAFGDDGKEYIVMGRGLGFQKKSGDMIDPEKIEKTYILENPETSQELQQLTRNLPQEESDAFLAILLNVEEELGQSFDSSFFIALMDHLHYAIERYHEGLPLQNPLSWEIRKFYQTEYKLGRKIVSNLNQIFGIGLDNEEASSIALHLVNAQKDSGFITKHQSLTRLVASVMDIVRLHFGIDFDEDSLNYHRFVTHVRYFGQRVLQGNIQGQNDAFLYEQVQDNYPQAFDCTQKIAAYVDSTYNFIMSKDEQVYLTIHIQRVTEGS